MVVESRTRRRHAIAPGELTPLDMGLASESREFARALRSIFSLLDTSLCDFATYCNRDKGAVSRYLSGKRVPPREFVDQLLDQARRVSGEIVITAEVGANLRELHLRALAAQDPKAARIQALKDDVSLHTSRKKDLEAELTRHERVVDRLKQQVWKSERVEVQRVIEDLQREVKEARAARREAEKSLALARAAEMTKAEAKAMAGEDIGILGCIM